MLADLFYFVKKKVKRWYAVFFFLFLSVFSLVLPKPQANQQTMNPEIKQFFNILRRKYDMP